MKQQLLTALKKLQENKRNYVVYHDGRRVKKTWSEMAQDIDQAISRLAAIRPSNQRVFQVGLVGPPTYEWMILDLACLRAGFRSVAVPEFLPGHEIATLFEEAGADVVLADKELADRVDTISAPLWFFKSGGLDAAGRNFEDIACGESTCAKDQFLDHYSIGYSSGTSGNIKRIDLKFLPESRSKGWKRIFELTGLYYRYRTSFWSRTDNKVLIFMPFSHIQQRAFVRLALMRSINIVLSDPTRCVQDLIVEKPNIMVSVPAIYEALAARIETELKQMSDCQKAAFRLYLRLGINRLRNRNWVKRFMERYLFDKIRKIYGGRADYFVTGSAPTSTKTLEIFYRVGVKIYEGYGQSELPRLISMSSERHFRIGSVGKPRVPVKIGDDSEIRVKIDPSEIPDASLFSFDSEGYICTSDLGYLDEDGFLFITGRKDDIIVLANGKKVLPSTVETAFHDLKVINSICVTSFDNKRIVAVVHWPAGRGGPCELKTYLSKGNQKLAEHEKVKLFVYGDAPFTVENGLLTATQKLRRNQIKKTFCNSRLQRVDD